MSIFKGINISAGGLTAQRTRMDVIAKNIANSTTTRAQNGEPYRRQVAVFKAAEGQSSFREILNKKKMRVSSHEGVELVGIVDDKSPFRTVYDPGHPDADAQGYVKRSNVDPVTEMVDMISATRSYEANVTALSATKSMLLKALEIGK
ncbi:MAG: flagellar basal body rod protein FlgC [Peptostreptococcaceae bacterium]|nr:flagellar basal body rod protein FlgC [Peptostreptococcaceae bacterium]